MPKNYPNWEMEIEVPKMSDGAENWEKIKDGFDWEPFYENLSSNEGFDKMKENEEEGIFHIEDGKNAFDIWIEAHNHV